MIKYLQLAFAGNFPHFSSSSLIIMTPQNKSAAVVLIPANRGSEITSQGEGREGEL